MKEAQAALDQLTQPELHMLQEALRGESTLIKKAQAYRHQTKDEQLRQLFSRTATVHQNHFDDLLGQLHELSGGVAKQEGR